MKWSRNTQDIFAKKTFRKTIENNKNMRHTTKKHIRKTVEANSTHIIHTLVT